MLKTVPWLVVVVIAYNIVVFALPAPDGLPSVLDSPVFSLTTLAGGEMTLRMGDILMAVALLLFFVEIVKASINLNLALADQILSILLFVVCLVEFLAVPQAATSVFFVILVLTLMDVVSSFIIQIRFARRDISVEGSPDLAAEALKG